MKKNVLLVLLVSVGLLFSATLAFAGGAQEAIISEEEVGAQDWVQGVKELHWGNAGTMAADPSMQVMNDSFTEATGIPIIPHEIPGSQVPEYTRAMVNKESTFDTMWLAATRFFPDFPNNGWTTPLDDIVTEELKSKWPKGAVDAFTHNGQLMAIPDCSYVRIFLYRKDLFKEAGVSVPKDWNQLVTAAKKLTVDKDGDGEIDQWGYVYAAGEGESCLETFSNLLFGAGGKLWNDDGTAAFLSDEAEKTLQFLVDLVHKHEVSPETVVTYREGDLGDMYLNGNAAMVEFDMAYDVIEAIDLLGEEAVGGDIPPIEPGEKNAKFFMKPIGVVVSPYATYPEAAKRLALYYGGFWSAVTSGTIEADPPAYLPVYDTKYFQDNYPFYKAIKFMQENGRTPTHAYYSIIQETFKEGIQSAIRQTRTPMEALEWIDERLKAEDVY